MSKIRPLGVLHFSKSPEADVIAYNLYGAAVAVGADPSSVTLDYDINLLAQMPAPGPDQEVVTFDLSKVNGLSVANGSDYVFAVAAVDKAGNISDMSEIIEHPLDATPPSAPTGLSWSEN